MRDGSHTDPHYEVYFDRIDQEGGDYRFVSRYGFRPQQSAMFVRLSREFLSYESRVLEAIGRVIHEVPQARILEVGSGDGSLARSVALRFPVAQVVGVEITGAGVRLAARNAGKMQIFCQADARALPFASGSFDVVYSVMVLEHVVDPTRVLSECIRAVRRGGTVIICTPSVPYWKMWGGPKFFLSYLCRRSFQCHAVEEQLVRHTFGVLKDWTIEYNVVDFFPPRTFFKYIPHAMYPVLVPILRCFERLAQRAGWQHVCWAQIFDCRNSLGMETNKLDIKRNKLSLKYLLRQALFRLIFILAVFPFLLFGWLVMSYEFVFVRREVL